MQPGYDWRGVENVNKQDKRILIKLHVMKKYTLKICTVAFIVFMICCTGKKEKPLPEKEPAVSSVKTKAKQGYDTIVTDAFYHGELSRSFDIKVLVNRYRTIKPFHDSCVAKFTILEKASKKVTDTFSIKSNFYFSILEDKNNVRSYTTKFNKNKQVLDGDYGDIVVADLNFDKKDDIAIVSDLGNYAGSFYNFYLQGDDKKFELNRFLTDSMIYFPDKIKNNTLTTSVISGNCFLSRHVYAFDAGKKTWYQKSHTRIDVCKNKVIKKSE
jgi:hypothetical protein